MNLDRTSIIGIIICVLAYIGYEQFLNKKYPDRFEQENVILQEETVELQQEQKKTSQSHKTKNTKAKLTEVSTKILSDEALTLENDKVRYVFDQYTGGFRVLELKDYLAEDKKNPINLVKESAYLIASSENEFSYPASPYKAKKVGQGTIVFERQEGDWLIEQTYSLDETSPYGANLSFTWTNQSSAQKRLESSVFFADKVNFKKSKTLGFLPGMPTQRQTVASYIDGSSDLSDIKSYCSKEENTPLLNHKSASVDFAGFDNHYFLKALIPQAKQSDLIAQKLVSNPDVSCSLYTQHKLNQGLVRPGEKAQFNFKAWFGPKLDKEMDAYAPSLSESLDLGMFAKIAHVFLRALEFLYGILGNWGFSIIIFTLLLKMLLYPLVKSSSVSMYKMKKLQPEINKIKEKYKNDPQKQNQETLKFMSKHKANPLKGCLPMLPQLPLFFACWRTLSSSIELRHAPFIGWITDLSSPDPYYITPILLGLLMFLQQKLTPTAGMDKTQEKMLLFMPIMFSVFMLGLPAGVVLYSLTNAVVSIAQQQWLNRHNERLHSS